MTNYRVYRFDGSSRIEMAEWIEAFDDDDAVRQTRQLGEQSLKCELWRGNRLVIALARQKLGQ